MFEVYRKLLDLLEGRERMHFYLVIFMIVITGIMDMVGVAAILPFLAVVTDPEIIKENYLLSTLYTFLSPKDERQFLIFLGSGIFAVIVAGLAVKMVTMYAVARFSHMRKYHISRRLLAGYLRQPYIWFLDRHSSDLTKTVLQEVDQMVGSALVPAMRILSQIVSLLFLVGLLIVVKPVVAMIAALVLGGTYMLIFVFVRKMLVQLGHVRLQSNTERFRVTNEVLGGVKEVKLRGLEETYMREFQGPAKRHAKTLVMAQLVAELPRYALEAITFGGMIAMILILLGNSGDSMAEVLPVLGLFAVAGLRMLPAIQQIYHSFTSMRIGKAVLFAVQKDLASLDNRHDPQTRTETGSILHLNEQLRLDKIEYSYPSSARRVVDDLSLTIKAKTTVGIVGGTGAGKTTAVDLILGLLSPDSGTLYVDDVPVNRENLRAWQNNLGYVPQQIFLTDDSISANIAFGVPASDIDQAAVERAAKLAELHDFVISELPEGYGTSVGERGVKLSGGQRQRIGIARALYHDPDVLILDEATSALDNLTERAVMDAVQNLGRAKTIIMIAHRLTTVQDCDEIFLLERGKCTDSGTYSDLLNRNAMFREMARGAS